METISYKTVQKNLDKTMEKVCEAHTPVQALGNVGVLGAQSLFVNSQGALAQRLCLGIVA